MASEARISVYTIFLLPMVFARQEMKISPRGPFQFYSKYVLVGLRTCMCHQLYDFITQPRVGIVQTEYYCNVFISNPAKL